MTASLALVGPDARTTNWQFVAPAEPADPLVLAAGAPLPTPAACDPAHLGVVGPDLGAWAPEVPAAAALSRLCGLVAPGGWLLVGFGNPLLGMHRAHGARIGLSAARRRLRRAGLHPTSCYLALPDHRHPALLVPAERRAELDDMLRRVPATYVDESARAPRVSRRLRQLALACADATPHRVRVALAPGHLVVAYRPT